MKPVIHKSFESYLYEENKKGSGKASSYLKALHWLSQMLDAEPFDFKDCINIWSIALSECHSGQEEICSIAPPRQLTST